MEEKRKTVSFQTKIIHSRSKMALAQPSPIQFLIGFMCELLGR